MGHRDIKPMELETSVIGNSNKFSTLKQEAVVFGKPSCFSDLLKTGTEALAFRQG